MLSFKCRTSFIFYEMPSLLLLLVMSLAVVSNQAKDKPSSAKVAAKSVENNRSAEPKTSATAPVMAPPPAIAIIEEQANGLLMPSETDAPMTVKYWPSEKIELLPGDVAVLVEQKADESVEIETVAEFFKSAATIEDWMTDNDKANAQRFQKLIQTLETQLEKPQVYLFGEGERTVVVIGKVKGGFGGIVTLVVET